MGKLPLLTALLDYHKEKNLILSMPGNKCGIGFLSDKLGEEFVYNLGFLDITENDPLDNLHCPEGVIKESEELLAKTYGGKLGFFMVNGSSSGNLISIFSAFNEGDEVLVERNCHKSIYNGLILRKLKVTYIDPVIDNKNGIFLPPNKEKIYEAFNKCKNAKGIIITNPNYFGVSYDIETIIKDLKNKGLKVIIDAAHGAHFIATNKLPKSLTSLADYIVLSAHKTLPSLTQGGYLIVNDEDSDVLFYKNTFLSTSPSYLLMASLDYARYYLDEYGENEYDKLIKLANKWKEKINCIDKVKILSDFDLMDGYEIDKSRYVLILDEGYSGYKLHELLRKEKVQCEMGFLRGVVLILSPFNKEEDFKKIYEALNKINFEYIKYVGNVESFNIKTEKVFEPFEVFKKDYEFVNLKDSLGRVSKEAIVPYPPGIPLICQGEVITIDAINIVKNYLENNKDVIGILDGKVKVIKDNKF